VIFRKLVDGRTPAIAFATTGGKIILHSPHENNGDGGDNSLRHLNLNRKISSLVAGCLTNKNEESGRDMLFVGTQSNLLAYDVERNSDVFFVDVQDGVNSLSIGTVGSSKKMVIAGGNCSVLGFDAEGSESFWTVCGDNIGAMTFIDENTLLAGSDDFELRAFRGEESLYEISEADKISMLHGLGGGRFAYGLANGTVGVYDQNKVRMWRVKTKHKPTAIFSYDIDMDGVEELFIGWSNGLLTVRRSDNGSVIFRETFDSSISAILKVDYRMDGKEEVIICTEAGTITGYLPTDAEFGTMFESGIMKESAEDQRIIEELHKFKLELAAEMKLVEKMMKSKSSSTEEPIGSLPPNTSLSYELRPDKHSEALILRIEANADVQIMNVIVVDLEGIMLDGGKEVIAFAPKNQITPSGGRSTVLSFCPTRNQPVKLRIQTHVASRSLTTYLHVFETDIAVPRFAAFCQLDEPIPNGFVGDGVVFIVKDGLERFASYFTSSFILHQTPSHGELQQLKLIFQSLKPNGPKSDNKIEYLTFTGIRQKENSQSVTRVRLQCDLELAGDIIQDMAKYFNWNQLSSEADFPAEFSALEEVIDTVAACNTARMSLTADMADESARIKALIIRAEDSRLMMEMDSMRKSYTELTGLNNGLVGAYNIRMKNHESLLAALKEVNQMIQRSANLRVGNAKNRVVNDSRAAVKENRMMDIASILRKGFDSTAVL
jgi:Bardet-Biedl syndrome 2 protein